MATAMRNDLDHLRAEVAERATGLSRRELDEWLDRIRRDRKAARLQLERIAIVREELLKAWGEAER
ncbi:MAG: hypothetical protein D6811_06695 [Alphaproteobacteria bacterium]|nr:MAG: hypothetical protein D6811_06695 [Alphaproteobacteria bacterium]